MTRAKVGFIESAFFIYLVPFSTLVMVSRLIDRDLSSLAELFWPAVWAMAFLFTCMKAEILFPRRLLVLAAAFVAMLALKGLDGFFGAHANFGPNGFLLEFKVVFFLVISLGICTAFPSIDIDRVIPSFMYFSILEVVDWIIVVKLGGGRRTNILSEQNYDGFIILMGYALLLRESRLRWGRMALFFFATYCTSSRTGLFAAVVMSALRLRSMRNKLLFFLLVGDMVAVATYVFFRRMGSLRLEEIDRFVMIREYLNQIADFSAWEYFWGTVPGIPMAQDSAAMAYYINRQNTPLGLVGLHPFNFHGFLMRFTSSFGFPALLALALAMFRQSLGVRYKYYLLVLIIVQMFSLGVFYLTVISVPLLVLLFAQPQGEEFDWKNPVVAR